MTVLDVLHFLTTFSETTMIEVKRLKDRGLDKSVRDKRCFWSPDQNGRTIWDLVMFPLLAYIIVIIPLRIGFDITEPVGTFLWFFDVAIDVYFAIDIWVNFRTAIYVRRRSFVQRLSAAQLALSLRLHCAERLIPFVVVPRCECLPVRAAQKSSFCHRTSTATYSPTRR